jgi:hypothetical protein
MTLFFLFLLVAEMANSIFSQAQKTISAPKSVQSTVFPPEARIDKPSSGPQTVKVTFDAYVPPYDDTVLAYEVSVKSMFSSNWNVLYDSSESARRNASDLQIISVRVDEGKTLNGGTFVLGLARDKALPQDFEHLARTRHIPWNAAAAQVQTALQDIASVRVRHVRRCDEFGGGSSHRPVGALAGSEELLALGGDAEVEGWLHGCPYLERGGYRWLAVLERSTTQIQSHTLSGPAPAPLFSVFNEELGNTWSGPGPQVHINRIPADVVAPGLCSGSRDGAGGAAGARIPSRQCTLQVRVAHSDSGSGSDGGSSRGPSLQPGVPYVFRLRVLTERSGWTHYSGDSSLFVMPGVQETPRPLPPQVLAVGTHWVEVLTETAPPAMLARISASEAHLAQRRRRWLSDDPDSGSDMHAGMGMGMGPESDQHSAAMTSRVRLQFRKAGSAVWQPGPLVPVPLAAATQTVAPAAGLDRAEPFDEEFGSQARGSGSTGRGRNAARVRLPGLESDSSYSLRVVVEGSNAGAIAHGTGVYLCLYLHLFTISFCLSISVVLYIYPNIANFYFSDFIPE